jgi:hypothetical protein
MDICQFKVLIEHKVIFCQVCVLLFLLGHLMSTYFTFGIEFILKMNSILFNLNIMDPSSHS